MAVKRKFKKGDRVHVHRCNGMAKVVGYINGYGMYLLDRKMLVEFHPKNKNDEVGVLTLVGFSTFTEDQLTKIEI